MNVEITSSDLALPVSLSLVAICSFGWALRGHFVTVGRIPKGMRLLSVVSVLSYITYAGLLFRQRPEATVATMFGLTGITASIILFWWTVSRTRTHRLCLAHTDADPHRINTEGPYAFVRHPFYLSYISFWISTALIAGSWQWMAGLILTAWYLLIARDEERRFRSSSLSPAYDAYRQRTGMLLPRLPHPCRLFRGSAAKRVDLSDRGHGPRPVRPPLPSQPPK
jgi:protein-S-isoprenylcysteine O-methyltransferase Ste14